MPKISQLPSGAPSSASLAAVVVSGVTSRVPLSALPVSGPTENAINAALSSANSTANGLVVAHNASTGAHGQTSAGKSILIAADAAAQRTAMQVPSLASFNDLVAIAITAMGTPNEADMLQYRDGQWVQSRYLQDDLGVPALSISDRAIFTDENNETSLYWADGIYGYDRSGRLWGLLTSNDRNLCDLAGNVSVDMALRYLNTTAGVTRFDWDSGELYDFIGDLSVSLDGRIVIGDWSCGNSFTASTLEALTDLTFGGYIKVSNRVITPSGTTGNRTINAASGTVNFAAASATLTVTNTFVNANSLVKAFVRTNDTSAQIKNVVCSSGSFLIRLITAATAETSVGFEVTN